MLGISFEELREIWSGKASKLRLEMDAHGHDVKGRYFVATRDLTVGEVIMSEQPIFQGDREGKNSQKVYVQSFLEKIEEEDEVLHPRSPLIDCVAAVLMSKLENDQASLRKFGSLSPGTTDLSECAEELWAVLKPELQAISSREELGYILQVLQNCFHHGDSCHLLFAGSMFEHASMPNCFLYSGTYRALRAISEGEALSIDCFHFPSGPREGSDLPEVQRSFVCPQCREPELCPVRPGSSEFRCLSCKHMAEASYIERCLQEEAQLSSEENLLSHHHHIVVQALWQDVRQGLPCAEELAAFLEILESLLDSLRAYTRMDQHPSMLELYHLAALSSEDLEAQKHYLQLEHDILQRFFPDVAERQERDVISLLPFMPTEVGPK